MKRRATKWNNKSDEESRFSKKLFNKSDKFVKNLNPHNDKHVDDFDQKPAWVDEDDANFGANIIPSVKSNALYVDKLKQKYETLMGTPSWAKLKKVCPEEEVLQRVTYLHKPKVIGIKKDYLEIRKFNMHINAQTHNEGPIINCIDFHPTSTVALVGGQCGIVSLFSVGREVNDKLHSFRIKKWNISTADFGANGNEAYISARNKHNICVYDLIKGDTKLIDLPKNIKKTRLFKLSPDGKYIAIADQYDEVFILCTGSKELLKILKHNNKITSLIFSHDSKQLYTYCAFGEITIWDLSTYKSMQKFYDHACVKASRIATSPCGRLLATGSKEGIVNIYQTAKLNTAEPLPHKTISHLTTKVTILKFNPTTELLTMASQDIENSMKIVHIPSYHVYMNFPKQDDILSKVTAISFSPNSGYMAVGNNKHSAYLYRLNHFKNY